jgi:hypothetical protein
LIWENETYKIEQNGGIVSEGKTAWMLERRRSKKIRVKKNLLDSRITIGVIYWLIKLASHNV